MLGDINERLSSGPAFEHPSRCPRNLNGLKVSTGMLKVKDFCCLIREFSLSETQG